MNYHVIQCVTVDKKIVFCFLHHRTAPGVILSTVIDGILYQQAEVFDIYVLTALHWGFNLAIVDVDQLVLFL